MRDKILILLFLLLAITSCDTPYITGESEPGAQLLTSPETGLLPYPWDLYTTRDPFSPTLLRLSIPDSRKTDPIMQKYGDPTPYLEELTGFSLNGPIILKFDSGIDYDIIKELMATKCTDPTDGIFVMNLSSGNLVEFQPEFDYDRNYLFLYPYRPLQPATRYAVVLTDTLRTFRGASFSPDKFYYEVEKGSREEYRFVSDEIRKAKETIRRILPEISPRAVITFTTMSLLQPYLTGIRMIMDDSNHQFYAENFTDQIIDYQEGYSEYTGLVLKGSIRVLKFTNEAGEIRYNYERGSFDSTGHEDIPFLILYPALGKEPFPVMIYQHGLNNRKESVFSIADRFNQKGIAIIAIDVVRHGERNPNGGNELDLVKNFLGIWPEDGILRVRPYLFRDEIIQTVFNQLQLIEFLKHISVLDIYDPENTSLQPDGIRDLQGPPFGYQGQSLGGFIGTITTSLSRDIGASILNVTGGRISCVITENPLFKIGGANLLTYFDTQHPSESKRFLGIFQNIVDPGDPASFGPILLGRREGPRLNPVNLLMENVWKDMVVPNKCTGYLARGIGIPVLPPVYFPIDGVDTLSGKSISGNIYGRYTAAMSQYYMIYNDTDPQPATHGALLASPEAKKEGSNFLESYFNGLTTSTPPTIVSPY